VAARLSAAAASEFLTGMQCVECERQGTSGAEMQLCTEMESHAMTDDNFHFSKKYYKSN
jgi:hypothetical protein